MRNILLLIAIIATLVTSCDNGEYVPEEVKNLPSEIISDNGYKFEFDYDAQKRIIKYTENDTVNNSLTTFAFTYKNNTILRKQTTTNSQRVEESKEWLFTLLKGNREVKINVVGNDLPEENDTIHLNSNQTVAEFDGIKYEYSTTGNINKRIRTSDNREHTFTYDIQKGVFSEIKSPQWLMIRIFSGEPFERPNFFVNNLRTEKDSLSAADEKETYTYEYNDRGFPSKITYTNVDGKVEVFTIRY